MQVDPLFALLFLVAIVLAYALGAFVTKWQGRGLERTARRDAVKRSRAVLTGHFSEQLAPWLPDFPYSPTELRFIGKPVDYIVFEGLDSRDVKRVVFLEIKSGAAGLSGAERSVRNAVEAGQVAFEIYQAPGRPS
jgi:predicted Holliday junction resolvase-like endonuclease